MHPCAPSAALAALVLASVAAAQSQAPLRWPQVEAALDQQLAPAVAREAVEAARASRDGAGTLPDPELELSAGVDRADASGQLVPVGEAALQFAVESPLSRGDRQRSAQAELEIAEARAQEVRQQTWLRLRLLFLRLGHAEARATALERQQQQLARLVELALTRVGHGEGRPVEVTRLETELLRAQLVTREADQQAETLRAELAIWLPGQIAAGTVVDAELGQLPEIAALRTLQQRQSTQHPARAVARAELRAAEHAAEAERSGWLPSLGAGLYAEREAEGNRVGASLSFGLPLWNRNQAEVERSRAAQRATALHGRLQQRELAIALQEALGQTRTACQRAEMQRQEIAPRGQQTFAAVERMYQIGELGLTDLLDARRSLIDIELELLEASLACQSGHAELRVLTGDLS